MFLLPWPPPNKFVPATIESFGFNENVPSGPVINLPALGPKAISLTWFPPPNKLEKKFSPVPIIDEPPFELWPPKPRDSKIAFKNAVWIVIEIICCNIWLKIYLID